MGKVNLYYLIARNKRDNTITTIPVNGSDCGSLEDIDLFTMNFKNEAEFSYYLLEKGLISTIPVDLFIANQSKGEIYTQEVVYSYAKEIGSIANNSKNNQIINSTEDIDTILDSFSYKMKYNKKYYEMIVSTDTNIYRSFIDFYIDNNDNYTDPLYHAKYQKNSFARKSYKLIRNIVEANNRFDTYRYTGHYYNSNDFYRRLLKDKLINITDSNYISNQLSLLDDFDDEKEDEDKIFEILGIFDRVSRKEFSSENEELVINKSEFSNCSENDYKKIEGLLGEQLLILLYRLARANELYQIEIADNTRSEIMRVLGNDKMTLELAYQWCNIYNKYRDVYGDVDGYQYKKD